MHGREGVGEVDTDPLDFARRQRPREATSCARVQPSISSIQTPTRRYTRSAPYTVPRARPQDLEGDFDRGEGALLAYLRQTCSIGSGTRSAGPSDSPRRSDIVGAEYYQNGR